MSLRAIDFMQSPNARFRGGWWLAVGMAALIGVYAVDQHWDVQHQRILRDRATRLEALQASRRPVVAPAPNADERRLQRAERERAYPFLPALRAIESAAVDPVYVLALSFEPAAGALKIDAEAPSFDHALAFTQVLTNDRGLSAASLASHDTVNDAASGRPTVRFTVLARWRSP